MGFRVKRALRPSRVSGVPEGRSGSAMRPIESLVEKTSLGLAAVWMQFCLGSLDCGTSFVEHCGSCDSSDVAIEPCRGRENNTLNIPLPLCSSARRRPAHCREAPANMLRLRGREYVCLGLAIAPADVQQIPFSVFHCVTRRVTEGIASLEKQIKDSNTVKQDSTAFTPPLSLTLSPLRYMVVCAYASFMFARSARLFELFRGLWRALSIVMRNPTNGITQRGSAQHPDAASKFYEAQAFFGEMVVTDMLQRFCIARTTIESLVAKTSLARPLQIFVKVPGRKSITLDVEEGETIFSSA